MPTFFVTPDAITPPTIRISGSLLHHLRDSLRFHQGDALSINDGSGTRYQVEVIHVSPQVIQGRILETHSAPPRTSPPIVLAQALLKGEKMDWVIQKATELGVDRIVPVHSRHSVVKPKAERVAHQRSRWERIAHDAAQQSERWTVPAIADPQNFAEVCTQFAQASARGILTERSTGLSLAHIPLPADQFEHPIVLLIGPEGGWAEDEQLAAQRQGFTTLTLGPRILRAETAAIAALSILQSRLDQRGKG